MVGSGHLGIGWVQLVAVRSRPGGIQIESGLAELSLVRSRSVRSGLGRSNWFGSDQFQSS